MNVVIDTNVLVSGIFFGGRPRQVLEAAWDGHATAYASPEILREYDDVVEEMLSRGQGRLRRDALGTFLRCVRVVEPAADLHACRDPEDDKFLSCASEARASYIVSGDKDLLTLGEFRGTEIVTTIQFLERLGA